MTKIFRKNKDKVPTQSEPTRNKAPWLCEFWIGNNFFGEPVPENTLGIHRTHIPSPTRTETRKFCTRSSNIQVSTWPAALWLILVPFAPVPLHSTGQLLSPAATRYQAPTAHL
ncbi:hypothetical protein CRM22_008292 [Opisthorchis felineus]|uniref:Uncharacterized protein n=1 Tax=Opisthorchis felineus TaxID=147828 RepID=A0A4S2LCB9_OPIFE|nr:hypothetical protein CRM22_008292 [Opisthorchis felineus]TGZ60860.1 hypothetical protein CRM22_008292 [Opisthorchis felineus]